MLMMGVQWVWVKARMVRVMVKVIVKKVMMQMMHIQGVLKDMVLD